MMCCPYDPSHRFQKSKLHKHLSKCLAAKKNKAERPLLSCKKDMGIKFFKEEALEHFAQCEYCGGLKKKGYFENSSILINKSGFSEGLDKTESEIGINNFIITKEINSSSSSIFGKNNSMEKEISGNSQEQASDSIVNESQSSINKTQLY